MVMLLALGAYYDYKTTYVSDSITIPYAILGVLVACANNHYYSAILATYIILAQIFPKISLLRIISNAIKKRRPESDSAEELEENIPPASVAGYMLKLERMLPLVGSLIMGLSIICCFIYNFSSKDLSIINVILFSGALLISAIITIWYCTHRTSEEIVPATENVEGFGGADMLIFAGILGYYGIISFFACIVISLTLSLIIHKIYSVIKKTKTKGIPLLPSLFISFPVRIIIFQLYLYQFTATFDSVFANL